MVESGDVLGAIILPPDLLEKLQSLGSLNPETPEIEVLVSEEDPIKGGLVDDRISALLARRTCGSPSRYPRSRRSI